MGDFGDLSSCMVETGHGPGPKGVSPKALAASSVIEIIFGDTVRLGGLGTDLFDIGGGGATPDAPPRPVSTPRLISKVMDALLIERVQPEYPAMAKRIHLSGAVQLRAVIGTDGRVLRLTVVSGNPILAQAALAAVQRWRYEPTRLNGEPVEVQTQITVNFVFE